MSEQETLQRLNARCKGTLMETLGIVYTACGTTFLEATMPVSPRVHQPMGLLHGGASVALAESVGSAASAMLVNPKEFAILGLEISANHLKSIKKGVVTARAEIIHKGRSTHLWQIRITEEDGALLSLCKLTNMIKPLKAQD